MSERTEREALDRMRELLDAPSSEELEAAVPDPHVAGMWAAVRDARPSGSPARPHDRRARGSWLLPVLAAASVLLALVAGGLAVERERLVARQAELEAGVVSLERRLAALERAGSDGPTALASLASPAWERVLAAEEALTSGRARALLGRVPPGTTLLGPEELEALAAAGPLAVPPGWRTFGRAVDLQDGLQAGELLAAIEGADLAAGTTIPVARILDIYRTARRSARS